MVDLCYCELTVCLRASFVSRIFLYFFLRCSPCDTDVYYSGGRGRRVYRTDFRTGESRLVCITNAAVLDMALELGGERFKIPYCTVLSWIKKRKKRIEQN